VGLKRSIALGNVSYAWFERDKNLDRLRSDPEYQGVMAGVRQRWEAYRVRSSTPRNNRACHDDQETKP
jgi:hypothetical protein